MENLHKDLEKLLSDSSITEDAKEVIKKLLKAYAYHFIYLFIKKLILTIKLKTHLIYDIQKSQMI